MIDEHKCLTNQFRCPPSGNHSAICISSTGQCDGHADCPGAEDERNCGERHCATNHFRCTDGRCIHTDWVCNGIADCDDASDEPPNCAKHRCPERPTFCRFGHCALDKFECDRWMGCEDDDTCLNGAQCQKEPKDGKVRCDHCDLRRFNGSRCEQCVDLHCENGGHCVYAEFDSETTAASAALFSISGNHSITSRSSRSLCVCPAGYSGARCERSACDGFCQHGMCRLQSGQPMCTCRAGFDGNRCQVRQCPLLCVNDGRCVRLDGRPICLCPAGYSGSHCQLDLCNCSNGGRCVISSNSSVSSSSIARPVCVCPPHLKGPHCESLTTKSCRDVKCENGGLCIPGTGNLSAICHCLDRWTGPLCERSAHDQCEHYCFNQGICVFVTGKPNCL